MGKVRRPQSPPLWPSVASDSPGRVTLDLGLSYLWVKEGLPQDKGKSNYISLTSRRQLAEGLVPGWQEVHSPGLCLAWDRPYGPSPHRGAVCVAPGAWRRGLCIWGKRASVADKGERDPRKIRSGYSPTSLRAAAYKWSDHPRLSLLSHNLWIII